MVYNLNFNPTQNQLLEIEKWLINEQRENGEGFINNWTIISSAFDNNKLVVIEINKYSIGFVVYQIQGLIGKIDIAAISPKYRKKGIGKRIITDLLMEFKSRGVLVTELFCMPENSEGFWKKTGFFNFPELPNNNHEIRMYKPLVSSIKTSMNFELSNKDEIIELWNEVPHRADKVESKWKWKLDFKENTQIIKEAIIHPAHYDWQICWRKGDVIKEKDKVKYFESEQVEYGNYIIIRKLVEKKAKH